MKNLKKSITILGIVCLTATQAQSVFDFEENATDTNGVITQTVDEVIVTITPNPSLNFLNSLTTRSFAISNVSGQQISYSVQLQNVNITFSEALNVTNS